MNYIEEVRDSIVLFGKSLVSIIRIPFFARPWGFIKPAIRGKPLLILSNGPSLNNSIQRHSAKFSDFDLLGLNLFVKSDHFVVLKPQLYLILSPDMWLDKSDERLVIKKMHLWQALNDRTAWPLQVFLPAEAKKNKSWKSFVKNKQISIQYFNRTPIEGFRWFQNINFNLGFGMPRPHNVLIPSLMVALNLGYKSIFILGADHSWLPEVSVNENNEVLVNQKHFYDENTSVPSPMMKKGGIRKLHEVLYKWFLSFKAYFSINEYAAFLNAQIFNSTPNSFIDAFPRKDLSD